MHGIIRFWAFGGASLVLAGAAIVVGGRVWRMCAAVMSIFMLVMVGQCGLEKAGRAALNFQELAKLSAAERSAYFDGVHATQDNVDGWMPQFYAVGAALFLLAISGGRRTESKSERPASTAEL